MYNGTKKKKSKRKRGKKERKEKEEAQIDFENNWLLTCINRQPLHEKKDTKST
jgi:hypothetical protein